MSALIALRLHDSERGGAGARVLVAAAHVTAIGERPTRVHLVNGQSWLTDLSPVEVERLVEEALLDQRTALEQTLANDIDSLCEAIHGLTETIGEPGQRIVG